MLVFVNFLGKKPGPLFLCHNDLDRFNHFSQLLSATDLFFNYDLNELFAEGKGPKLNAFSFGVIF